MANFATVDQLNDYVGRDVPAATAELLLAGASSMVRGYCRWNVERATETFTVDTDGGHVLTLPTLWLESVTEVRAGGDAIDPDDYEWSHHGQLVCASGWAAGLRAVEVDAVHGFDPVPDAIVVVTLSAAARQVENPSGVKRVAAGTVNREWFNPDAMSTMDRSLLDPFRLPLIP